MVNYRGLNQPVRDATIKFDGAPYNINNGNVMIFDRSVDSSEKINRGNKTEKYRG